MSEFHVRVITVDNIVKHENADALEIIKVGEYPVIVRLNDFHVGDKAVYVPIDSEVPLKNPLFSFLDDGKGKERMRIRAKRLRGVFSMGILVHCPDELITRTDDIHIELGITKWEPPEPAANMGGECVKDPGLLPYYDIEGLRKFHNVLIQDEPIVITEKIHGANGRGVYSTEHDQVFIGSHRLFKKESDDCLWWRTAKKFNLPEKLRSIPDIGLFFEVYGYVQDLRYDMKQNETSLAVFDAINTKTREYLNFQDFIELCNMLNVPVAPILYRGPWRGYDEMKVYAEGKSEIASHVREGFVIKPEIERFSPEVGGRLILKLHGEGYLVRKS